jgi:hypothetical protein
MQVDIANEKASIDLSPVTISADLKNNHIDIDAKSLGLDIDVNIDGSTNDVKISIDGVEIVDQKLPSEAQVISFCQMFWNILIRFCSSFHSKNKTESVS